MKPAKQDLEIYQGSTFVKSFQWKTGVRKTPVDITGFSIRMQIRKSLTDTAVEANLTTENGGIVITDSPNGKFEIRITSSVTDTFTWTKGVYDLEMIYPEGEPVIRLIEGNVVNKLSVTR